MHFLFVCLFHLKVKQVVVTFLPPVHCHLLWPIFDRCKYEMQYYVMWCNSQSMSNLSQNMQHSYFHISQNKCTFYVFSLLFYDYWNFSFFFFSCFMFGIVFVRFESTLVLLCLFDKAMALVVTVNEMLVVLCIHRRCNIELV